MIKYGSGISIKSAIMMSVQEIEDILAKTDIKEDDKKTIISNVKELAFRWCKSNATACCLEEITKSNGMNCETLFSEYIKREPERDQKMTDTYPWYCE